MELSREQLGFFRANGYLILEGILDPELCARARERMWAALPDSSRMRPDDPSSHIGPIPLDESSTDSLHIRDGFRWQLREIGTDPLMIDLCYSASLRAVAQQLLGGELREPVVNGVPMGSHGPAWPGGPTDPAEGTEGARGIYCTLPYGNRAREPDQCHTDGHPFNLGMVGLIDDVPEDGGAFKIWPGSHRRLFPHFLLRYDQPRIPYYEHLPTLRGIVHTQGYLDEIERLNQEPPVECWGRAGDVVLWHHRLAHMAGHNYSEVIRWAVLADFCRTDLDACRTHPAQDPMWADWSEALQGADEAWSDDLARAQRLPG